MIDCQKIKALAEQQLVGTDVFVVSCKVSPSNEVELLLDSDTSVQLETCAAVNRAVNEAMVDDEEDFSLTVASAGTARRSVRCSMRRMPGESRSPTRRSRRSRAKSASSW